MIKQNRSYITLNFQKGLNDENIIPEFLRV